MSNACVCFNIKFITVKMSNLDESLSASSLEKISFGEELLHLLEEYDNLEGVQKLKRKIAQELNFLKKVLKHGNIKKEHLQCSNLTHFSAVVKTIGNVKNCTNVNKVVMLGDRKITIDIICDDGLTWVKVIARNPKSLSQVCMGDASYGVRSIIDQAEDFIESAKLYPCLFQIPKIIFVFVNGVGNNLAARIESLGVIVEGNRITDVDITDDHENCTSKELPKNINNSELSTLNISHISKVNLDVSAMLAYVSSVTNGSAGLYEFSVHVLAQQAKWELQRPQKPILDKFFEGKKLYCCQTAKDNFVNIVNTVGGPNEKIRAEAFLKRIIVLPDNATAEDLEDGEKDSLFKNIQLTTDKSLSLGGKIRERSLIIFTFGDRIGAVTVTANDGFVRSAKQQGINFVVFVHESRALTEQKEMTKGVGPSVL